MKFTLVFAALLVSCYGDFQFKPVPGGGKIVGGADASISDYPWQLQLEYLGSLNCGASIISEKAALCAAHCIDGYATRNLKLRSGSDKAGRGGQLHQITKLISHPDYDDFSYDNDVAIILVDEPFDLASAVPLAESSPTGGSVIVTGFGRLTENGELPTNLQAVSIPFVDRETCNDNYNNRITDAMFCAGVEGKDSCQGDSGGPVIQDGKQVGIVSWGIGCAREGYPGVYTDVAYLLQWIKDNSQ